MEKNEQITFEEKIFDILSQSMEEATVGDTTKSFSSEEEEDEDEYEEEYVSEDEIARENGFWIDDDGNWQPLDDDEYDW